MNPIVELQHARKTFGRFVALHGIDLDVQEGEFVSLLGPSGCGKTTTLRLIAGFENPSAGDVLIGGRSVIGTRADKRGVAIVFQNYALFPHMNVFENVAFGLRARRFSRFDVNQRTRAMLELMELGGLAERRIHELSGGQQQRVALARALAIEPRVLLLDEPLGALDKKLREQMQVVLMDLHRELGMTMVYVTHDQEEALSMSRRIAVMRHGHLVQYGSPVDLYYSPDSLYVCRFVGNTNVLHDHVGSADGRVVSTSAGMRIESRQRFLPGTPCAVCVRPEHVRVVPEQDITSDGNRIEGVVLERVFLGQTTTYILELSGGARFEASFFSEHGYEAASTGDRLTLSFSPNSAHVFSMGDETSEAPIAHADELAV